MGARHALARLAAVLALVLPSLYIVYAAREAALSLISSRLGGLESSIANQSAHCDQLCMYMLEQYRASLVFAYRLVTVVFNALILVLIAVGLVLGVETLLDPG